MRILRVAVFLLLGLSLMAVSSEQKPLADSYFSWSSYKIARSAMLQINPGCAASPGLPTACSECAGVCKHFVDECKDGNQASCYRAAACLCQCNLDAGGCGSSHEALQKCVDENTKIAKNWIQRNDVFRSACIAACMLGGWLLWSPLWGQTVAQSPVPAPPLAWGDWQSFPGVCGGVEIWVGLSKDDGRNDFEVKLKFQNNDSHRVHARLEAVLLSDRQETAVRDQPNAVMNPGILAEGSPFPHPRVR